MPTQKEIADHLGMNQSEVSRRMATLGIDWKTTGLDAIRLAYIRHLRGVAAGHRSQDGTLDLAKERAETERVDRQLKQLQLAEKLGQLVNVAQLEPELERMFVAFRTELLARDDKLISDLNALYGIEIDPALITEHTRNALAQLARYDVGSAGDGAPPGGEGGAAGGDDDDGMGPDAPAPVGEGER